MRKIGYVALSLYLMLVSLSAGISNLIIPNVLMVTLAFIASFGIFLDICMPSKSYEKKNTPIPVPVPVTEKKSNRNYDRE